MDSVLLVILFLGVVSFLTPFVRQQRWCYLYTGITFLLFLFFCFKIPAVDAGQVIFSHITWFPDAGVNIAFRLDGLSLLFSLLITGIGAAIVFYSGFYLKGRSLLNRYYGYLFLFMFSMLGAVLSNNLITLFIFWELTSVSSYLLISFQYEKKSARRAALQGLLVTVLGGFGLLVASVLFYRATGTFNITTLFSHHMALLHSHYYLPIVLLIFLAAFTKSAQWPFHFWLPNAMEAPTPVSAYLHSATMVKLGVYLIARLIPVLGGTHLWQEALWVVSSVTMLFMIVLLFRATDMKRMLAYSTVMALSTLFFLLAGGNRESVIAAMAFLLAHALYKGSLFLCAGNIEHATGTRSLLKLTGLLKQLPYTFTALLISAASMAGLPLVFGFVVKELIYEARLMDGGAWELTVVAVLVNVVFVAFALLLVLRPFFGRKDVGLYKQRDHWYLFIVPLILAILTLILGVFPDAIDGELIGPAAASVLGNNLSLDLKVWHGLTPALMLSIVTIVLGCVVFFLWPRIMLFLKRNIQLGYIGPQAFYHQLLNLMNKVSGKVTRSIQTGRLRDYVSAVFLFASLLVIGSFLFFDDVSLRHMLPVAPWFGWVLAALITASAFSTVIMAPYFASLVMLSVVGFCATLFFLLYSAPDVAMTQLLVDVMTIVIVVLALCRLPRLPRLQSISKKGILHNVIIAALSGLMITLLMLACINIPFDRFINEFYVAKSLSLAHGRNVVNVILVDFRAFDTLGEVVVVAMAGLGVYGLLRYHLKTGKRL